MTTRRKTLIVLCLLILSGVCAWCRILNILDVKTMMATSKLVFIGRVKSVNWSGMHTRLTYPTWGNVDFEWQRVECEVLEPVKGCSKGDIVQTAMLAVAGKNQPEINAPELVNPKIGEMRLFFLLRTPVTNLYASLNSPYYDALAILPLDRKYWECNVPRKTAGTKNPVSDRGSLIRSLVNDSGDLIAEGVVAMRKQYRRQIKTKPKNDMMYLEWESVTNQAGWSTDVPKGLYRDKH
jgi:hypothetical protein